MNFLAFAWRDFTLIGDYRDYSCNLFADITYKTFEWNPNFNSTLEPITFTFEKDYVQDITKYLDDKEQFTQANWEEGTPSP